MLLNVAVASQMCAAVMEAADLSGPASGQTLAEPVVNAVATEAMVSAVTGGLGL